MSLIDKILDLIRAPLAFSCKKLLKAALLFSQVALLFLTH